MTRGVAVVAGASGFVGQAVVRALVQDGHEVRTIGRRGADASWSDPSAVRELVDRSVLVVNLAGKSVNCRYTDRNRDQILGSRVETTRALGAAIRDAARPPALWINASTATIYRYAMDRPQLEDGGELGTGFSVDVARAWEDELFAAETPDTRRVAARMAIVIGDGPATRLLFRLARLGLGGPQYDGWWFPHRRYRGIGPHPSGGPAPWHRSHGRQRFSWIHIDDVVAAMRFLRDSPQLGGAVNLASPHPSDNRTLMRELRAVVGARVGLPSARFMLEPAMWVLRTEPELLLKSRWVQPQRLLDAGFAFGHPDLAVALDSVLKDAVLKDAVLKDAVLKDAVLKEAPSARQP